MVAADRGEFVYAPTLAIHDEIVILNEAEAHHLYRVRRVGVGDKVWVTTGEGVVYEAEVKPLKAQNSTRDNSDRVLEITNVHPKFGESSVQITLGMAVLKGDMNREIVDMATQLGARGIHFFQAEHSEGRLREDKLEKLRRVAITAIKQCGRAWLPEIKLFSNLSELLNPITSDTGVFIAHPASDASVASSVNVTEKVALVVGPEGGLSEKELQLALQRGKRLHLGNRRLRAEMAVAAGLSYLLTNAGEMSQS